MTASAMIDEQAGKNERKRNQWKQKKKHFKHGSKNRNGVGRGERHLSYLVLAWKRTGMSGWTKSTSEHYNLERRDLTKEKLVERGGGVN